MRLPGDRLPSTTPGPSPSGPGGDDPSSSDPSPTVAVRLPGGRQVTVDDVGDPAGVPVLYLHGTPDSRLSRHPDDGLAARAGVRLLALDRPGYGGSDPLPPGAPPAGLGTQGTAAVPGTTGAPGTTTTVTGADGADGAPVAAGAPGTAATVATDVAALLDHLGVERCAVLAWSGGALDALTVAAGLGDRVSALGIAAGLVPRQAYDDPAVRAAAPGRLDLLAMADEVPPGELGEMVAPMLAPWPCDRALAAEHQAGQRGAVDAGEVAAVEGAAERLADGLVEGVRAGLSGVAADVEAQNRPFPLDLSAVTAPTLLWWGGADTVTPAAFGAWYATALPGARLTVTPGAGHYLPLVAWADLLADLAAAARPRRP